MLILRVNLLVLIHSVCGINDVGVCRLLEVAIVNPAMVWTMRQRSHLVKLHVLNRDP